jgi:hypothetical protein
MEPNRDGSGYPVLNRASVRVYLKHMFLEHNKNTILVVDVDLVRNLYVSFWNTRNHYEQRRRRTVGRGEIVCFGRFPIQDPLTPSNWQLPQVS